MSDKKTPTWSVYRHAAGTKYHAPIIEIVADSSDAAILELRKRLLDEPERWRAFRQGEVLILRSDIADAIHVLQVQVDVAITRVERVAA